MENNKSRWLFLAALAGVLSPWLPALADSTRSGAALYPDQCKQPITDWGYDIKEPGKAAKFTPELAQAIFVEDKMTCLRVPIYGDGQRPAHPAAGQVLGQYYSDTLAAIAKARQARPSVLLFASKRLEGKQTFPAWVLNDRGVDPDLYAGLLADYLDFMHQRGISIDILGVDNEMEYNHGNITPEKQKVIMDRLQSRASKGTFTLPRHFIGPESYDPNPEWVGGMHDLGGGQLLDLIGTHYYPNRRPVKKLEGLAKNAAGRPVWLTELHWPDRFPAGDVLAQAKLAFATIFDATSHGVSGFVWWQYTREGLKGEIETEITRTLANARPMEATSGTPDALEIHAFRHDAQIIVWAVDDRPAAASDHFPMHLMTRQMTGPATYRQWTNTGWADGEATAVDPTTCNLPLPAGGGITRVIIPISNS